MYEPSVEGLTRNQNEYGEDERNVEGGIWARSGAWVNLGLRVRVRGGGLHPECRRKNLGSKWCLPSICAKKSIRIKLFLARQLHLNFVHREPAILESRVNP